MYLILTTTMKMTKMKMMNVKAILTILHLNQNCSYKAQSYCLEKIE